jgi:C1q domain
MKKLLFVLFSSQITFAQVTTLPNSIGIGQNTNASVPLHIKKNGEVARFEGTWPYVTFYDGITMNGYIQGIYPTFEIGTKNNFNLNFFTGNAQRLSIDGTNGMATFSQKIIANGGVKLSGPIQAQGESVGADGMVLVSKGNATPAWEDQRVGFRVGTPNTTIPDYTEAIISTFGIPYFNDGAGFNSGTGIFTAPSDGLYSFNIKCKIHVTPTPLDNFKTQIKLFKNSIFQMSYDGEFKTFDNYANSVESNFLIKLVQNDQVTFSFFQVSPNHVNLVISSEFFGYKVY